MADKDIDKAAKTTAAQVKEAGEHIESEFKKVVESLRKTPEQIVKGIDPQIKQYATNANALKVVNEVEIANRESAAAALGMATDEYVSMMDKMYEKGWSATDGVYEPLEKLGNSLKKFEIGFGANLKSAGGAVKELTGGILDLNSIAGDGMDKVNAAVTLIATPFKLLNTAVAKTTGVLGKEINVGQKLADAFFGVEQEIDGETKTIGGIGNKFKGSVKNLGEMFGKAGESLAGAGPAIMGGLSSLKDSMIETGQKFKDDPKAFLDDMVTGFTDNLNNVKQKIVDTGKGIVDGAKGMVEGIKGFPEKAKEMGASVMRMGRAFGAQAKRFIIALGPMIVNGALLVAGVLATAASFLLAAAGFLALPIAIIAGVALLIAGVMWLVQNFQMVKDTITEKIGGFVQGIKDAVGSITEGFMNVWHSISDWVRGKILKWKGRLFGLSDEEEAELKEIEERQEGRKKAKEEAKALKKLEKDQNTEAFNQAKEQMKELEAQGKLEGMSTREKMKLMKKMTGDNLAAIKEEQKINDASTSEVLEMREKADSEYENAARAEQKLQNTIDSRMSGGGTVTVTEDGETRDATEEERRELFTRQAESEAGHTMEQVQKYKSDKAADSMRLQMELGERDDYVESKVLTPAEEEAIGAKAMGMSVEQYREERDDVEYGDTDFTAANVAIDRADGDRIKDAADYGPVGPPEPSSANVNQAVQNVNVNNSRKVIQDPAPHNPDPTGSRLSVVPA